VTEHEEPEGHWLVMLDPEGNEFCLHQGGADPTTMSGTRDLVIPTFCRYILPMKSIGLRELNQNPSRAIARVRAGESIIVTDRGRPVLRLVPEVENPGTLERMVSDGVVRPPAERGMPDIIPDLIDGTASLSDLVIADRDRERNR
jgi:prevent-host-death family protein